MCSLDIMREAHVLCVVRRSRTISQACGILGIDPATLFRWRAKWKYFRREMEIAFSDKGCGPVNSLKILKAA